MSYCRKCGKELEFGAKFCPSCGTKVDTVSFSEVVSSVKSETEKVSKSVAQKAKSTDFGKNAKTTLELLGSAKPLFFATIAMFVLNFFLSFSDMIEFTLVFSTRSTSFLGLFKLEREYTGKGSGGDADYMIPILTVCLILIVASAVLTALPLLFGKEYNRRFLLLNYWSSLAVVLVYVFLCIVYKLSNYSENINIKFMTYVYIAQTVACFVVTLAFSKKLKANRAALNSADFDKNESEVILK